MTSRSLVMVTIHMTREMLAAIDEFVRRGIYPSRSEFIREAVTKHLANIGVKIEEHTKHALAITTPVEEDGDVTVKCAKCGYEMVIFSDDSIASLIRMLRSHRARCPKCGSNELTLEFTKPTKKLKTAGVVQV